MKTKTKSLLSFLFWLTCSSVFSQSTLYEPNELLIKWRAGSTSAQQGLLRTQARANAVNVFSHLNIELWKIDNMEGETIKTFIDKYSKHPDIEFAEPNYIQRIDAISPNDIRFETLWGLHNTGQQGGTAGADIAALDGWDIIKESPNTKVAIIDTGIDWKHPDLVNNIWQNLAEDADGDGHVLEYIDEQWVFDPGDENGIDDDGNGYIDDFIGWDFRNNDNNPYDEHAHGTYLSGIVGGEGNNEIGITGVTWDVQLVALKFLEEEGSGRTSDAIAAINYAVKMGVKISNNSWGQGEYSAALYAAIQEAATQNHLFVAAAGNEQNNTDLLPHYPSSYDLDNILAVAATDNKDRISQFSNYGAGSVDLAAPGLSILSCTPNNTYGTINGTSGSVAYVAGACALLWELHPNKPYTEVKEDILNAVDVIPSLGGLTVSGGRLNLCKLLDGCIGINSSCVTNDSLALVALYQSTNGGSWSVQWDLNQPFTTWHGIHTNSIGCVTGIDLSNNQLSGTIPVEIGQLDRLQELCLSNNNLVGTIPEAIGQLVSLRRLSLNNNQLTGGFPSTIDGLSHLQRIDLSNNQLTGNILPDIGKLFDLQELFFQKNQLSGELPSTIGNLYNLNILNIGENQLTGSIPSTITQLVNLQNINLSHNQLTGVLPTDMEQLANLFIISLQNNQLTGMIPATLGQLVNLQSINLSHNRLSGCFASSLNSFCNSTYDFSDNPELPDGGNFSAFCSTQAGSCESCYERDSLVLVALYNATNGNNWSSPWNLNDPISTWHGVTVNTSKCVTELTLTNNNLEGIMPSELGDLSNLQQLNLNNNSLNGSIPSSIGNLNQLLNLNLGNNQLIGGIPVTLSNLNTLQVLDLSSNQLSGCFPQSFVVFCNSTYDFSDNSNLPNSGDFSAFCTNNTGGCTNCTTGDSLVLVTLYNATNGSNWTKSWDLATPISTWHGITTNSEGCVRSINLSLNGLNGVLPPQIGDLSNLELLYLYENQLTGSIPVELGKLSKLKELHLAENQLTGIIPPDLGNLNSLQGLYLYVNQLTGIIPTEIGQLSNLQNFAAQNNQLTGAIPSTIGNLVGLQTLSLFNNQLTGNFPFELTKLINLKGLSLQNNQLTGSLFPAIGDLTKLIILSLENNQLTGSIPIELGSLNDLQILYLNNNQLNGCFPQTLTQFCSISYNFSGNANLPGGGDFGTFCTTGAGNCIEPVWPGDFNNDGVTNNIDPLYWGVAQSTITGPVRPNASSDWFAQYSPNWSTSVDGINNKHQDGDGNGTIDQLDFEVILKNYGRIHKTSSVNYSTDGVVYKLKPLGYTSTSTIEYELLVEDALGQPLNVHGLACLLDFGNLEVVDATFNISNSSLEPSNYIINFDSRENILNIALTRTDKTSKLCNGALGVLTIQVAEEVTTGTPIFFRMEEGYRMHANTTFRAIATTSLYDTYSENTDITSNLMLSVAVTHKQCGLLGAAEATIRGGAAPYNFKWSTGATSAKISNLLTDIYSVTVSDVNGLKDSLSIEIEGQLIPIFDENGQVVNCDVEECYEILPLANITASGVHQASVSISSNSTIPTRANVTFKAGESISLQPGFTAEAGCSFLATIEPCTTSALVNENQNAIIAKTAIADKVILPQDKLFLQLTPNPVRHQATITYQLTTSNRVQLTVLDLHGRPVKHLLSNAVQEAGKHDVAFITDDLTKGIYFISLQTGYREETKKMIILK